jgi:hypothetical protein
MKRHGVAVLFLVLAGCGGGNQTAETTQSRSAPTPATGAVPWPAPPNPMALTRKAGLTPETHEFVFLHVHSRLFVFVNGKPVPVPAGIGIDIDNPAVHSGKLPDGSTAYGGIAPPCAQPCISPLHTHDDTGVLHTEAKEHEFNTLGQLFTEWAVRLDDRCAGGYCKPKAPITVYVDGERYAGDPRNIKLEDKKAIAIVIGTPPDKIPSSFDA